MERFGNQNRKGEIINTDGNRQRMRKRGRLRDRRESVMDIDWESFWAGFILGAAFMVCLV